MDQLTKEQAIALAKSEFWKAMSPREIAEFQLYQDKLCMPFGVFHEAVEKALGRPVHTHEFGMARNHLISELRGELPPPTIDEIIAMIPPDKRLVIYAPEKAKHEH